ncbi:VOC family protein [Enterococcus gilvus]|uniref:VOC family protein n=1 Tax=Enterococcus gilvus TaxID=160453 RepID=UPI00290C0D70|nr:VOC family protein [Enterococcus gilvus]MDU5511063.1 hypothetical protein [Enterococcus gilvus]
MLKGIEIMLYVNDVAGAVAFWQQGFDGTLVSQQPVTKESLQATVQLLEGVQLVLFDRKFIEEVSPEVVDNFPSLVVRVSDLAAYHERLKTVSPNVNPIMEQGDRRLFNFADLENNYFVLSE